MNGGGEEDVAGDGVSPRGSSRRAGGALRRKYDWQLDELASAGRENLDPEHAARYDFKEDAGARQELALLQELGLNERSELVDLGAGTGQLALAAAPVCARVVAVDVSPVMLGVLRDKVQSEGCRNVEVVQSGFLSYEHRGNPADFVYSRFALHHLPDFWKVLALQRMRRMLRAGGVLRLSDVVYSFEPGEAEDRLEVWCSKYDPGVEGGWTRTDVEEHIRDEHSTYTWLLEPMITRSGFRIEQANYSADGLLAQYVARA